MTFAIAAAGTGGHVFPGLAVGRSLMSEGVGRDQILFVGGARLESEVYPTEGFPFLSVELRGLKRSLSVGNLGIPRVVGRAVSRIGAELSDRGVGAVLGMGGYVTVPAGLAAKRRRIPLMVSEQNAEAGLANRMMGRLATRMFGSFPTTHGLRGAEWVGNPIRPEITDGAVTRKDAADHFGLDPNLTTIGVIGGSLGAKALNEAVTTMVAQWDGPAVQIVHLCGPAAEDEMRGQAARSGMSWRVVGFEPRMEMFYPLVDLVVARAGGMVAELTATATPSILVPGRFGSGDHQARNALVLERHGAAVVMEEDHLERLGGTVVAILTGEGRLDEMRGACTSLSRPDAATTIARAMIGAVR